MAFFRKKWRSADIEAIRQSGLFDQEFYQARRGRRCLKPIQDYLSEGERQGIPPSPLFDPVYYRVTNPDVVAAGLSPLLHYIHYGENEGRLPNKSATAGAARVGGKAAGPHRRPSNWTRVDVEAIRRSGLFDPGFYQARRGQIANPIEDYLSEGERKGIPPSASFDPVYYRATNPDVVEAELSALLHYIRHGCKEGRLPNRFAVAVGSSVVGGALADRGPFSGLKSLFPFLAGARNEKRFDDGIGIKAVKSYDPKLPTILLVVHDASRTGAPMVGVELARHFGNYYNVAVCALREGELVEQFAQQAIQVVVGPVAPADAEFLLEHLKKSFPIDAVVLNSVETASFAAGALYAGVPSVALIHEFAEYTMPPGKASKVAAAVDRAIVPAKVVLASLQHEMEFQFGAPTSNVVIRPQGIMTARPGRAAHDADEDLSDADILARLGHPATKPPIVLCAGFVHMRKGVELFVQTAQEVRREIPDVRFVWAGAGYEPQKDVNYSVWLQETIRRLGLENTVVFLPPQINMDHLYSLCDVFFLSSRLDPFPSVVLEAMQFGKQVVCFDKATGSAELFEDGLARGAAVEYANVTQAARAIVDILRSDPAEASEVNRRVIAEKFQFHDYVGFIKGQIDAAKAHRARINEATSRILESKAFDADFHEGRHVVDVDLKRVCLDYVARNAKGLTKFSPRPGFSDNVYRSQTSLPSGKIPLEEALKAQTGSGPPVTHRCVRLDDTRSGLSSRAALHMHFHYPELASEFVERLSAAALPIDLFLTTTASDNLKELKSKFADYKHGRVEYFVVPNRGRDIGPFLTTIGKLVSNGNYDILGHLHAKRSLAVDRAMGDRWRKYLLDTLLGSGLHHLLSLFDEDEKLGLVFAEDRHVNGWGKNLPFAEDLAKRAKPQLKLPAHPYFPLGTMFWARPAALEPLSSINFKVEDFPPEPVPYDGSPLHAIERVLPSCVEAAGYKWCTVYDPRNSW